MTPSVCRQCLWGWLVDNFLRQISFLSWRLGLCWHPSKTVVENLLTLTSRKLWKGPQLIPLPCQLLQNIGVMPIPGAYPGLGTCWELKWFQLGELCGCVSFSEQSKLGKPSKPVEKKYIFRIWGCVDHVTACKQQQMSILACSVCLHFCLLCFGIPKKKSVCMCKLCGLVCPVPWFAIKKHHLCLFWLVYDCKYIVGFAIYVWMKWPGSSCFISVSYFETRTFSSDSVRQCVVGPYVATQSYFTICVVHFRVDREMQNFKTFFRFSLLGWVYISIEIKVKQL